MWFSFRPYVPVHVRRAQALREVEKRRKQGQSISPVVLQGRTIARTFWGKAWCENLESYSDYANRLPRGRTYVRNGSVVDLQIQGGKITALVSGSSLYEVTIRITALPDKHWHNIKTRCAGAIGSLVELLQGRLSKHVMDIVTARADGLFPHPDEIKLACSCPDWAGMCKHVAAVLYGVGARLDSQPELLFRLREVDHVELVEEAVPPAGPATATGKKTLAEDELAGVFGIELAETPAPEPSPPARRARSRTKPAAAKTAVGRKRSQAASSLATEAPTAPAPAPSKPRSRRRGKTKATRKKPR